MKSRRRHRAADTPTHPHDHMTDTHVVKKLTDAHFICLAHLHTQRLSLSLSFSLSLSLFLSLSLSLSLSLPFSLALSLSLYYTLSIFSLSLCQSPSELTYAQVCEPPHIYKGLHGLHHEVNWQVKRTHPSFEG